MFLISFLIWSWIYNSRAKTVLGNLFWFHLIHFNTTLKRNTIVCRKKNHHGLRLNRIGGLRDVVVCLFVCLHLFDCLVFALLVCFFAWAPTCVCVWVCMWTGCVWSDSPGWSWPPAVAGVQHVCKETAGGKANTGAAQKLGAASSDRVQNFP